MYTITVQNNGLAAATTVALSDTLPGTMTFVSMVQNSGPGFSCVTPSFGAGGTVTCSIATLANGAGASFTLTAHIPSGTASGTVFTNFASVTSAQDPTPENDSATAGTTVASADLALTMNGPASVNAGAPLSYTIDIANGGPDATTGAVSVANTLPASATAASGSGSGWSCGAPSGGIITCTSIDSVANGASFPTLTIAMTAPANSGNVQNSATVSSSADPNPANDSASVTTNIAALTDVSIVKSGPSSVVSGQNIVYTIVVTNAGPSTATGVAVSDPTPPSLTFVSNSGACTTAYPCNLGTMAAGQSATIMSTYSTPPTFSGNVSNTATVSATTTDPNAANNSATAVTNVSNAVDLAITKTASAPPYLIGTPITYTIVVTNAGPASAAGVSVTDVIPPGTTFTSATPSQGSCSGTTTVTCALGTIASGGSATISLVLTLPSAAGSVPNTATVTTSNSDTNPANNSSTAAIFINVTIPAMTSSGLLLLVLIIFGSVAMSRRLL